MLICDDDGYTLDILEDFIQKYVIFHPNQFYFEFKSQDPKQILTYINEQDIQGGIYILDIDFKTHSDLNGIDLAEKIRRIDTLGKIIFFTSHSNLAYKTLERNIEPLGYLVKDSSIKVCQNIFNLLEKAYPRLQHLHQNIHKPEKMMTIKSEGDIYQICMDDFILCETTDVPHYINYIFGIKGEVKEVQGYESLSKIFDKHIPHLIRISRFTVVNPKQIYRLSKKDKTVHFNYHIKRNYSLKYYEDILKAMQVD